MRVRLVLLLVLPLLLAGAPAQAGTGAGPAPPGGRAAMLGYARDTWRSMVALTDAGTGLPADNMTGPVTAPVRSGYTSPTNIGGYLWSTVVARDTGVIGRAESYRRLPGTPTTLGRMGGHRGSGMFYHWDDAATAAKRTSWAGEGGPPAPRPARGGD